MTHEGLPLSEVAILWTRTGGKAWEPRGGVETPEVQALVSNGWARRCAMRCGFEAFDTGLDWTQAAREYFAALERARRAERELSDATRYVRGMW